MSWDRQSDRIMWMIPVIALLDARASNGSGQGRAYSNDAKRVGRLNQEVIPALGRNLSHHWQLSRLPECPLGCITRKRYPERAFFSRAETEQTIGHGQMSRTMYKLYRSGPGCNEQMQYNQAGKNGYNQKFVV